MSGPTCSRCGQESTTTHACTGAVIPTLTAPVPWVKLTPQPDPKDAEIARLQAQVTALQGERDALKVSIDLQYAAQTKEGSVFLARALAAEAEVEAWRARFRALVDEDRPDMAGNAVIHLRAARDEALAALREVVEALDDLTDWQNGPPLITYTEGWNNAMRKSEKALAEARAALAPEETPPRFVLEGLGVIDTVGGLDRCTGCGKLPPHDGCKAICAACAPPTGACSCAGCSVAGKALPAPPPRPDEDGECPECHASGRVLMRLWNGGSWNETGVDCPGCMGTGRAPKEGK